MSANIAPINPGMRYQRCVRCLMDTTDTLITFDEHGVCMHCRGFDATAPQVWRPNDEGRRYIEGMVEHIKRENRDKDYDVVVGLSGGADSSYLAYKAAELGLRALMVHVDTGWNSELAVKNIENIVKKLKFDLHTIVIDWENMKDLQLAYLWSGVANQDTPQDHAIFTCLYRIVLQTGIKYTLSGVNFATECILPTCWGYNALDSRQLRAIHKRFGRRPLDNFPVITFAEYCALRLSFPQPSAYVSIPLLNYMPYDKPAAMALLASELGFRPYAAKHGESRFTKFYQGHLLPTKWGFDKRLPHLSSLIVSGQITRDEALKKLQEPRYDPRELEEDIDFFCKKLGLSRADYDVMMALPVHNYQDYPNNQENYAAVGRLRQKVSEVQNEWARLQAMAEHY